VKSLKSNQEIKVKSKIQAGFLGVGSYLPEKILTNHDLEKMVDTSDEWITTRTGIRERHIAAANESTSDMAAIAGKRALDDAGLTAADIDLIIVATFTPDLPEPAAACFVQHKLGAPQAAAFDLAAACCGFIFGLTTAKAYVESGIYKRVLLIGSEKLTAFTDWTDRSTCVLFGDGAGAAVIGEVPKGRHEILSTYLATYGKGAELLRVPAGGSRMPASAETVEKRLHYVKMAGNEVFKIAVRYMVEATKEAARRAQIPLEKISLVIPHQANSRILLATAQRLKFPPEKMFINIDHIGNVSAATVGIALDEAVKGNRIKIGEYIALLAFGGGLTLASSIVKW
jgi:3-oxoacyl-[acyl-carrier-protein] synthase-3